MMGPGSVLNRASAVQPENTSFSLRDVDRLSFNRPGCGTLGEQTSARMGRRKAKTKREKAGYGAAFLSDFSV